MLVLVVEFGHQPCRIYTLDFATTGDIDVTNEHQISFGEGLSKFMPEISQARRLMRLEEADHATLAALKADKILGCFQGSYDLGRVMGIVVHNQDALAFADYLEADEFYPRIASQPQNWLMAALAWLKVPPNSRAQAMAATALSLLCSPGTLRVRLPKT